MAALLGEGAQSPGLSSIGFEGYEKRLEISFHSSNPEALGLRSLSRTEIDFVLEAAQCTIVSQLSTQVFDSYVLSESSLFVYPHKIILKTCGTTALLLAVPRILSLAAGEFLSVSSVRYSRGNFFYQDAQPAPHRSFAEEVAFLNRFFPGGRAHVVNRRWHLYVAAGEKPEPRSVTAEICMTGLDRRCAAFFYKNSSLAGIQEIMPEMEICEHEFDPCGYSMNGAAGGALSSVHVTPEEECSYASYEAAGFEPAAAESGDVVRRVLGCFGPAEFSVAVTVFGGRQWAGSWGKALDVPAGYYRRGVVERKLPGGGLLIYQAFSALPREETMIGMELMSRL